MFNMGSEHLNLSINVQILLNHPNALYFPDTVSVGQENYKLFEH